MWVVFRKSDRQVLGTSGHAPGGNNKRLAVEEVVRRFHPDEDLAAFDGVEIADGEGTAEILRPDRPGRLRLGEDGKGKQRVVAEEQEVFALTLRPKAKERHPVDDLPLIPSDGESSIEILVLKVDGEGKALTRSRDNDQLWLRTDAGALLDHRGTPIRSLRLSRGEGSFLLRSDPAPRVASVRVFSANPGLTPAMVQVEFAPPESTEPGRAPAAVRAAAAGNPEGIAELGSLDLPESYRAQVQRAAELLKEQGCKEIYLFGSLLSGEVHAGTDLDLAIRGYPKGKLNVLRNQLAEALEHKVDLVDLDSTSQFARHLRSTAGELVRIA